MRSSQHRNAWIWVAVAAMAVATATRADAEQARASVYSNPVLQFLAAHADPAALAAAGVPRTPRAARSASEGFGAGSGSLNAFLAVEFVGLVAPLNLAPARMDRWLERAPAEPAHSSLFQRPPPSSL